MQNPLFRQPSFLAQALLQLFAQALLQESTNLAQCSLRCRHQIPIHLDWGLAQTLLQESERVAQQQLAGLNKILDAQTAAAGAQNDDGGRT